MSSSPSPPDASVYFAISQGFGPRWDQTIRESLGASAIMSSDGAPETLDSVRYAVAWHPEPGLLARLPNLKAVFSAGAGVDHILSDPALPDVPVVRLVDPDMTTRMGEWVALQVLSHHRFAVSYYRQQMDRVWAEIDHPSAREICVGVMGLGVLGQHACEVLRTIGYKVAGWSRTPRSLPGVETCAGDGALDAFLAATNILVCLLPHTPETEGLINARFLERLGTSGGFGPVLINAGRGRLQVEADILAALDSGRLRGVSLDVFEVEPLPRDNRLWTHPRVILTPHAAAYTSAERLAETIRAGIERLENGELPEHLVDKKRGY